MENWIGYKMPKYEQTIIIYVPKEYKAKAESYLKEYNNPNNIVYEDVEELKNAFNDDEAEKREYKICGIIMG